MRLDGDFLSEDFCVMAGRHFFVRAVLEIPVHGQAEKFGFGCWSTLSRANFENYLDGFDNADFPDWVRGPAAFATGSELISALSRMGVHVYPQPDRQRPTLRVANPDHLLAVDQVHGISAQLLVDTLRFYKHESTELENRRRQ